MNKTAQIHLQIRTRRVWLVRRIIDLATLASMFSPDLAVKFANIGISLLHVEQRHRLTHHRYSQWRRIGVESLRFERREGRGG